MRGWRRSPRSSVSYYEIWTPEDVEIGETDDRGDLDDVTLELDEDDREEGLGWADQAVEYLLDEGTHEASSSSFHPGIWYTYYGEADFRTGERENRSFHLKGFTEEEQRDVYNQLKRERAA